MANMTFYIKPANEKKLKKLEDSSMGGLVNHLLEQFFEVHTTTTTRTTVNMKPDEAESFKKNLDEVIPFYRDKKKGKL
jgi:phosphoribosylformylglycinamidine (FGAM) synthase-like enzyme